jgi:ubiquinone/menaquinone biosynthesis C-methylase UbiE
MESIRKDRLESFVALLKSEGRHAVLGLDCGAGADGLHFVQSGIHFTGVDPSEENIHAARAHGLEASVAGPAPLPFADAAFSSVWAVDALAGLPPEQWDDVVRELGRVAESGAPIAVVLPAPGPRSAGAGAGAATGGGSPGEGLAEGTAEGFTVLRAPA